MPMYEYLCKKCEARIEELQGYDDPAPKCKKCKTEMQRCLPRSINFALKGGGWFKDGYQKTGKKEK